MSTPRKTTPRPPLTPEQLLAALQEDVELDDFVEKVAQANEEELAALLAADGITPEMVAEGLAKDRAMVERLQAQARQASKSKKRRKKRP